MIRAGVYAAGDAPPISVVVPTHEGSIEWLGECLEGLAQQEVAAQVVLVLDGPAPRAAKLARRVVPAARQLALGEQRGFAVAATAGLRAARAPLVALLNDDAVPEAGWLEALLAAASRHPNAGSFASRVLRAEDPLIIDSAGHGLTRWGEPFAIGSGLPDGPCFDVEREVFGAPASASVYRAELLRDCGTFDVAMGAYLEDVELSLRARVMGFPCVYVPDARVLHRGGASYGRAARRLVARNRVRLMLRSMPRNLLRSAVPAVLVSTAAEAVRGPDAIAGTIEGFGGARDALAGRAQTLGARRATDTELRSAMRQSEDDLATLCSAPAASLPRRARGLLAASLKRLVESRERQVDATVW